jgi:hypothetical protein
LISQSADPRRHSTVATKLLRLTAAILVALSFVILHVFRIREVGTFAQVSDGKAVVSVGSHPAIIVWDAVAMLLFVILMLRNTNSTVIGIPSRGRRVASFMIDFWFSLLTLSGIGALASLALEAARTGRFVWHFQRPDAVGTDTVLGFLNVLVFLTLVVLYFAFPLTRGKQTVGCFIMRIKTTPPFGDAGRFTFRAALRRTFYEFRGLTSVLSRDWKRDSDGRTWFDVATNCTVVLIDDD